MCLQFGLTYSLPHRRCGESADLESALGDLPNPTEAPFYHLEKLVWRVKRYLNSNFYKDASYVPGTLCTY